MIPNEKFSSKLLTDAIEQLAKLPGVGKKTALRYTLHLLGKSTEEVDFFVDTIKKLKHEIKICSVCFNYSDSDVCQICSDATRDHSTICVVENIKDIIAIENTLLFKGVYHVLGGLISPIDGISPNDLQIDSLEKRLKTSSITEIIIALNTTMEGETTSFYLYKRLSNYGIKITTIARGVGFGDELEYTDEITLGKAIQNRVLLSF